MNIKLQGRKKTTWNKGKDTETFKMLISRKLLMGMVAKKAVKYIWNWKDGALSIVKSNFLVSKSNQRYWIIYRIREF